MAEDKLYEESNESLSDKFLNLAAGTVAAGAAAVSFYRSGGARLLSRQYGRYRGEFQTIRQEIGKLDYDHINKNSLKELLGRNGRIRTSWREYKPNEDYKADLTIRPGTIGELVRSFLQNDLTSENSRRRLLRDREVVDKVVAAAQDQIQKALDAGINVNREQKRELELFARMAARRIKTQDDYHKFALRKYVHDHMGLQQHFAITRGIMQDAIYFNSVFEKNTKVDRGHGPKDEIQQILLKAILAHTKSTKAERASDAILGDRRVRLGEMLDHADRFSTSAQVRYVDANGNKQSVAFIEALQNYMERVKKSDEKLYNQLRDVHMDAFLRTDGKNYYSFMEAATLKNDVIRELSGTMPGKVLKLRSFDMAERTPLYHVFRRGTLNEAIAAVEKGNNTGRIQNDYYYVDGKTYRYDYDKDKVFAVDELDKFSPVSSRFGSEANILRDMYGYGAHRYQDPGSLGAKFGMGDSIETRFTERLWNLAHGIEDTNNTRTILKHLGESGDFQTRYADMVRINELLQSHVEALSPSQVRAIRAGFSSLNPDAAQKIMDNEGIQELVGYLEDGTGSNDENLVKIANVVQKFQGKDKDIRSPYLRRLLDLVYRDQTKADNSVDLINSLQEEYNQGALHGLDLREQFNKGLSQEFILRYAEDVSGKDEKLSVIKDIIENHTDMSAKDARQAKNFAYAALVDDYTHGMLRDASKHTNLWEYKDDEIEHAVSYMENLASGKIGSEGAQDVTKTIHDFARDYEDVLSVKGHDTLLDYKQQYVDDDYIMMRKAAGPMSIIESINEAIKQGSSTPVKDEVLDIWHQLKAGRDDPENISRLTMVPYFFLHRLADNEMLSFLQFSDEEKKSSWGLVKGVAKRLAPLAIGGMYLEWADDTVGAITGTRPAAAIINSLDYMDIGVRKLFDTTGIGGIIQNQMEANPIMQYWFGKDGYYTAEQQRDQYANGYEPVRSGRYWDFGSVNEFRGAQVQYFEPTLTRRLNSDYYNKAMYSGYWDKWAHSLLPTPAMPLSPLIYAMDPYYLENEHSEDRPYAVSGTMFQKDTPWGIVLNPTIGQLIKPVTRLHTDRLDDDGHDAKAIIYGINKRIYDTATANHAHAMVFDREQITAGEYTGFTNPSMGEYVIDIGRTAGQEMRQKQLDTLGNGDMELERREKLYEPSGSYGGGGGGGFLSGLFGGGSGGGIGSTANASAVSANAGSDGGGFLGIGGGSSGAGGASPLDLLGQTNRRIYQAAAANTNTGGVLTKDRIRHYKMDDVLLADDAHDLVVQGGDLDLEGQAERSFRLISGIYGYGANRAFGFGESDGRQIADSGDMDSFSRSFWDESLGGLGGGAAEIGRRFIPEFRRNIRYSPLLNNMPDWIPETLRFGDPYAAIPKGEARLPGEGYEALNALHPDKYGTYGSFDRFKILADVAPLSSEYKIWSSIAAQTVKDPQLQDEMEKIRKRVREQNKDHDFYPYMVLGQDVNYKNATVTEVDNNGYFRIQGSDELYKIAGLQFQSGWQRASSGDTGGANPTDIIKQFVQPGMDITLAIDQNEYHQRNSDEANSINAAVFVGGESLAKTLLEADPNTFKKKDMDYRDVADTWALTTTSSRFLSGIGEAVAHMDLPMVHDRWLRVRDPLESYNAEQVYGTPYQTWSDLTGTYLFPAMERAVSNGYSTVASTAEFVALSALHDKQGIGKFSKWGLSGASVLLDRGAFIGATLSTLAKPGDSELFRKMTRLGAAGEVLGSLYTSTQSSTGQAAAVWGMTGFMVGDILDDKTAYAKMGSLMKKFIRDEDSVLFRSKYAAAGAAIGVAARGMFGPSVEGDGRDQWTPERVQKKWKMEDYFDRLNYIKNMGLYHKAAELAEDKEGIRMEKIFADYDKWSEKRQEIMRESDVNTQDEWIRLKQRARFDLEKLKEQLGMKDEQNHRFEYANGFSINDLPGVRNGVFHSEEISEEERLYTLNALVTMGTRYTNHTSDRSEKDRDMTQLTAFEHAYGIKIPSYYQVHHIVEFSENGPDDPSNMIALNPDDHLYITEQQKARSEGEFSAAQIGARTAMRLGEYGRAALLYKKAAESTMYGLRADARWTDVEMALPRYERDYFVEFMKEKDPDKQEEILKTVSPFLRRALKQVWGMDYEKDKGPDNEEYFESHNLPNFLWEGWRPDSDLNNVKAKTIKNEGMLFSDFGIYESKYRDPKVINAPNLSPRGSNNPLEVQTKLTTAMNGLGLQGVEVSVEPKSTGGVQSIINMATVTQYEFKEKVNDLFSGNI